MGKVKKYIEEGIKSGKVTEKSFDELVYCNFHVNRAEKVSIVVDKFCEYLRVNGNNSFTRREVQIDIYNAIDRLVKSKNLIQTDTGYYRILLNM